MYNMTVQELIEKLKTHNPNDLVKTKTCGHDDFMDFRDICNVVNETIVNDFYRQDMAESIVYIEYS